MNVDVHTLSGAYALDALSREERDTFRAHLAACPACREEVEELRDAAARMGAAQWSSPSPGLRSRVLDAAARTPQQPPARPVTPATPTTQPTQPTQTTGRPGDGDRTSSVVPLTRRRWPAMLASAAAVVALALGGVAVVQSLDDGAEDLTAGPARVFDADDVRRDTFATENGGALTVGISESRNQMAVDARELPPLDRQHVYQLWTVHDGAMVSAAVLTEGTTGAAMGLPAADTRVAVTVEPAGGSEQPTSEPIVEVDPTQV
ncbi:anti-sigma factor [Nocardioides sp. HDW12B]|uniref:anti-sigma factor n=1 Tax=Nocardioides sp. HDW12B TaxID=2714939 RepID=UPI00140DF8E6|nr:anti-sigma factor [Nocardioides sp. HDW12B]QIK65725.1 anti-sigma factor [Nocardioides sp. HDW12B]